MRYKKTKIVLICWCLFIGIGALVGGTCMLIKPDGSILQMQNLLPYFEVLPFSNVLFQNYIFPGISLIIVNGLTNLIASYFLFENKKVGTILGGIFGITLMMWITIQFIIFPKNVLSISYFIFGIIQALTGYMCYIFYTQEHFIFKESDYKNIENSSKEVVVFFSREGYTKKIAYELANNRKCSIMEIKTKERIYGTLGFWWCGRFGMLKKPMNIIKLKKDITKYDNIIICFPIWVFGICAPVRKFVYENKNKIKNVEYVYTHFMKSKFKYITYEMDNLLNTKCSKSTSVCVRFGRVKKEYVINK